MAICPECGQPKSVSTWWIFETAVGYISLSTLFELGVVVTFILALFKGDFRSAFIEMCSFFVTPVFSGLFLFLLYCYWARYKCDAIQRPAIAMPTLVATPWPNGPVVVSTPVVQRYSGCPGHLLSS